MEASINQLGAIMRASENMQECRLAIDSIQECIADIDTNLISVAAGISPETNEDDTVVLPFTTFTTLFFTC